MTISTRSNAPASGSPHDNDECRVPAPVDEIIPPPDDETLATLAKAIAHPTRLAILRLLGDRHTCATGDLVAELPLAQSTVSEHLRILRQAGLIQGEIEGPRTHYCVNATGLAVLRAGINGL